MKDVFIIRLSVNHRRGNVRKERAGKMVTAKQQLNRQEEEAMDEKKIVVLDVGLTVEEIAAMAVCCKGKPSAASR